MTMNTCRVCERPNLEVFACDKIEIECTYCCGCEDHGYDWEETNDY